MNVKIELYTMYEPGEMAPDQFNLEHAFSDDLAALPRFKDQIIYDGREYNVRDVIFNVFKDRTNTIRIKAVRKITYQPKADDER